MKSKWSIWGDYLIYRKERYGARFSIREKYAGIEVTGWLAFDTCSRIKNSFGSTKPLGSFKTRKEAAKFIENKLRGSGKIPKRLSSLFIKTYR